MGLGRNGIGGNHLDFCQTGGFRNRMTAFYNLFHLISSSSAMALRGHSVAHTPHPLQ
jgi:hypothetical protein